MAPSLEHTVILQRPVIHVGVDHRDWGIPQFRLSAPDVAAQVIASSNKPMRATDMVAEMEAKGLWRSPGGKTPEATLYAAIIREIAVKGKNARFVKHDRGLFVPGKMG